jgi:hypothetical protein
MEHLPKDEYRLHTAGAQLYLSGTLVRLFTVFVSSIEARQPRAVVNRRSSSDTRPSQLKEHSTLKSLCRGTKKNRSYLARQVPSSRAMKPRLYTNLQIYRYAKPLGVIVSSYRICLKVVVNRIG